MRDANLIGLKQNNYLHIMQIYNLSKQCEMAIKQVCTWCVSQWMTKISKMGCWLRGKMSIVYCCFAFQNSWNRQWIVPCKSCENFCYLQSISEGLIVFRNEQLDLKSFRCIIYSEFIFVLNTKIELCFI